MIFNHSANLSMKYTCIMGLVYKSLYKSLKMLYNFSFNTGECGSNSFAFLIYFPKILDVFIMQSCLFIYLFTETQPHVHEGAFKTQKTKDNNCFLAWPSETMHKILLCRKRYTHTILYTGWEEVSKGTNGYCMGRARQYLPLTWSQFQNGMV